MVTVRLEGGDVRRRELGACLRAHRELVRPADVGLPAAGHRRTPGLRREEVAQLAGVGPAISYVLVSGCAWRLVPQVRERDGRDPQPSAAVLDSQSVKSSEGGEEIGYDAGKRVRGRKRHLLVDTLGLLLVGIVHSASMQDRAGARRVLTGIRRRFPLLGLVRVDGGDWPTRC
ncbi:hypothetical protein GCM10009559_58440 [Pseudonocardia zijingensis]|jgi:transposase|uniref:Transposase IS4-like domain-containing protein n=1 Tax=Pseudonocardia zijingensis TaxID=153376 RepID=A0ABN1N8J5_9PSEU